MVKVAKYLHIYILEWFNVGNPVVIEWVIGCLRWSLM